MILITNYIIFFSLTDDGATKAEAAARPSEFCFCSIAKCTHVNLRHIFYSFLLVLNESQFDTPRQYIRNIRVFLTGI